MMRLSNAHNLLNKFNVLLTNTSYNAIVPQIGDFFFIDPPYSNVSDIYVHDDIDYNELLIYLDKINAHNAMFLMTIDDSPEMRKLFMTDYFVYEHE